MGSCQTAGVKCHIIELGRIHYVTKNFPTTVKPNIIYKPNNKRREKASLWWSLSDHVDSCSAFVAKNTFANTQTECVSVAAVKYLQPAATSLSLVLLLAAKLSHSQHTTLQDWMDQTMDQFIVANIQSSFFAFSVSGCTSVRLPRVVFPSFVGLLLLTAW